MLDFPEVRPGVNSIGPRQMVTGVFVTLRAPSVEPGEALVFHSRSSNLHAADLVRSLARAHAIATSIHYRSGRKSGRKHANATRPAKETNLYDGN